MTNELVCLRIRNEQYMTTCAYVYKKKREMIKARWMRYVCLYTSNLWNWSIELKGSQHK